jgi:N-glycosidase YbiA
VSGDVIRFHRIMDAYGEFSNSAPYPISVNGKQWPTSEHFYQAQKFAGLKREEEIRLARSPMEAARMARSSHYFVRADWDMLKDQVMLHAVRAKFQQHRRLADRLLATGDVLLVQHTPNDAYWGDGGDGTGENRLGRILMFVRAELREMRKRGM